MNMDWLVPGRRGIGRREKRTTGAFQQARGFSCGLRSVNAGVVNEGEFLKPLENRLAESVKMQAGTP